MKPTNKKVEALAPKYMPWAIAWHNGDGELLLNQETLLDVECPKYIRGIRTFSTWREAQEYLANMFTEVGIKYKIVRLAVVI